MAIHREPLGLAEQVVDDVLAVAQEQVVLRLQVPDPIGGRQLVLLDPIPAVEEIGRGEGRLPSG